MSDMVNEVGLNICFETIEKQYKYYTYLACHRFCLLSVCAWGCESGQTWLDRVR